MAVGLDTHAVANEAVIGEDRGVRVGAVRTVDMLFEGAAERGVDDLHTAADAQQRCAGAGGVVDESELSLVGAVPVATLAVVALRTAVVERMDVLAAHDDDRVGGLCT